MHFTTPELKQLSESIKELSATYSKVQQTVVNKVIETALTYVGKIYLNWTIIWRSIITWLLIGLIEASSALIAELDVLVSFAAAAALAPIPYVRPKVTILAHRYSNCLVNSSLDS